VLIRRFCVLKKVVITRILPITDVNTTTETATDEADLNACGTSISSSSCLKERVELFMIKTVEY